MIGYEESSQLDVEPAKYFVLVTKREKRACRSCEELGVLSAPLPPRIIEKCRASDRIVIDTVVGSIAITLPLYRQSVILERDISLKISRATLDGWVLKVGELLIPMVAAMRRELISGSYIQADETPVDVQTREGRGTSAPTASGVKMTAIVQLFPAPRLAWLKTWSLNWDTSPVMAVNVMGPISIESMPWFSRSQPALPDG